MQNKQIIPDGWMVRTVKQFGKVVSGGTPDTNNCSFWGGDIFWLTPSEVSSLQNRYIYRTKRTITKGGLDNSSAMLLPKNSLILCTRATIGDCCINAVEMCTNQGFKNIIVNKDNNVEFLYYLVLKNKNELLRKACGSTFLEISKKDVEKLKFVVPPLPEQEKIAEILSCWDDAIEQMRNLISEKKELKRGLMQQLLSGKKRLPMFVKPWETKLIKDIAEIFTANSKSKYINDSGKYLIVDMGAVSNDATLIASKKTDYSQDFLNNGDIIMPKDDIGGGNIIGKTVVIPVNDKYIMGDHVFKLVVFFDDRHFISYLINSDVVNKHMRRMTTGSAQLSLAKRDVEKTTLFLPSDIKEQRAIADVLMAADAEIDLLQQQLQAIAEQKQGLMQQLLTGNIRVKIDKKS